MLDFSHIPQNLRSNFSVFYNNGRTSSVYDGWQVWNKPRGVTSIYILCIGAGGRGAAGTNSSTGVSAQGGAGGGSGGITTALIQASMIPDILYVYVGVVEVAGAFQTDTYVSLQPSTTAAYTVCYANHGSNAVTVTEGAGGTAATTTNMILGSYGIYDVYAGQDGAAPSGSSGGSITWGSLIVSGGASGGGKTALNVGQTGGSITGAGFMPTVSGGGAGVNGFTGLSFNQPLMFCGGSGGGGVGTATAAGIGGNGGIGSGGGGGGAFATGGSSGGGGGGPGLVLIWGF